MISTIIDKIERLGGQFLEPNDCSLRSNLEAIKFSHSLYEIDCEIYGLEEFLEDHNRLFLKDPWEFYRVAKDFFLSARRTAHGQSIWCNDYFSPTDKEGRDYAEWQYLLSETGRTYFAEIKKLVGSDIPLEFIQIVSSFGYPDHYYVCLADPNPENPTVFGTDHEALFQDIRNLGPLDGFLDRFMTETEFTDFIIKQTAILNST